MPAPKHVRVFMSFFGYDPGDFIPCIWCGGPSNAIHHIRFRSLIFGEDRDKIENLCSVCQIDHDRCHNEPEFNELVKQKHLKLIAKVI